VDACFGDLEKIKRIENILKQLGNGGVWRIEIKLITKGDGD